jgi:SnoaL-like domain
VATPGGSAQGIEAVVDQARRNHSVDATHHIMATIDVDVDGDQATARAKSIATFVPSAGRPRAFLMHGERYALSGRPHVGRMAPVEGGGQSGMGGRPEGLDLGEAGVGTSASYVGLVDPSSHAGCSEAGRFETAKQLQGAGSPIASSRCSGGSGARTRSRRAPSAAATAAKMAARRNATW